MQQEMTGNFVFHVFSERTLEHDGAEEKGGALKKKQLCSAAP